MINELFLRQITNMILKEGETMNYRKTIHFITLLAVLVLLLSACGQANTESVTKTPDITDAATQNASSSTDLPTKSGIKVSGPNEFPIVEEPIELEFFSVQVSDIEDIDTNALTMYMEELTQVHINWTMVPEDELTTKLNLSLASKDYPDVYLCAFTTEQIVTCIEGGILTPIQDLIEDYTFNTKMILEENPDFAENLTATDGNIYTLFYTDIGFHVQCTTKMFVYKTWFDSLDIDMPETTEEFKEMLMMFKERDMNGNGDTEDELPLVSSVSMWSGNPLYYLMAPFQLNYGFSGPFIADEAKNVQFVANTDGWKQGLEYIHDLYESGLIATETYVQDSSQLKAIVNAAEETNRIAGCVSSFYQGMFTDKASSGIKWEDYMPVPPLEGPSGEREIYCESGPEFKLRDAIASTSEYPEAAIKWLDYWLGEEGSYIQAYGLEDEDNYSWVEEESILGEIPSILSNSANPNSANYRYGVGILPKNDTPELRYCVTKNPDNNGMVLYDAALLYEPYYQSANIPRISWCSDTSLIEDKTYYQSLIDDYVTSSATKFIIGELDLDSDWDDYLQELDNMGLKEYTQIMQEYYFGE